MFKWQDEKLEKRVHLRTFKLFYFISIFRKNNEEIVSEVTYADGMSESDLINRMPSSPRITAFLQK